MKKNFVLPLVLLCTALTVVSCENEDNKNTTTVAVSSVKVSPSSAIIGIGATTALTATIAPANATNSEVSWISDKPNIAEVSDKGIVTGKAVGNVVITATALEGGGDFQINAPLP